MATKNFTEFDLRTEPLSGDYLVGYKADGSTEIRTTVGALVSSYATSTALNAASSVLLHTSIYQSASGSLLNLISTTFVQLTSLKANNQLVAGQYYRISDFQLMWWNQSVNDMNVKSGLAPEPLIVLALSGNRISHEAKSELYPQDTVYYDIDATSSNSWGIINNNIPIPNFKGWIYRRIDHKLNIDIPWDWRNITVNCCRPDMSSISLYSSLSTYDLYSVVKNASNKLYYSTTNANSGQNITNTDWWLPVSDFVEGDTYFSTDESFGFRAYNKNVIFVNLPANTGTRIQQPTFTSSLVSQGTFSLTNCNNIKIEGGYSNVILGNSFYSNTIGNNFNINTIGNNFNINTIGNNFNINTIGNYFRINTIGDSFYMNIIRISFYWNTIGNNFYANTIGNNFYANTIGNDSYQNTIGNLFFTNTIGDSFRTNTIGNNFSFNTIGNGFYANTIENAFRMNTSEGNLTIGNVISATHVYNSYHTRLFENSNQTVRLSYFNSSDQLVVTDPTA